MNLIVAVDKHWGIGYQDRLLFRISEDMKNFRALTLGKTVILGRKTLETFPDGRPLDKRTNIVLSTNPDFAAAPALTCGSLAELRDLLQGHADDEVFVIGGASVYRQLLPFCRLAYVTKIHQEAQADCFFPDLDELPGWELISSETRQSEQGQIVFTFCLYRQIEPREFLDEN